MPRDCTQRIEKRLYTIPEAAKYLGHTIWAIRSLIWGKEIPYVRYGRKMFLDLSDLDAFIDKHKRTA